MSQSPSPSTSNPLPPTSLTSLSHTNQPSSSSSSQDPSTPHAGGGEDGAQQGGGGGAGGQGMPSPKAIIKSVDMNEEMQQEAVDVASAALEKFNIEKDIAMHCKKEFDRRYGSSWHCVVGKNYGSFVTHETKHFIYFYLGQIAILLWKSS